MKYGFLLVFLGLTFSDAVAQPRQGLTISGQLMDADQKEPLAQASVQLFLAKDSSFVGGTISNIRGDFSVEAPSNGIYRLRISSVGFQTRKPP